MTCLQVRERLTEHALGLLPKPDAREVERHLEWCAGCRKESTELQEGAASVAFSLPLAEPRASLEWRIVDRLSGTSRDRKPSRRGFRILVAATLSATLGAVGAMSWAIAERHRAADIQAITDAQVKREIENVKKLEALVATFTSTKPLEARLRPTPGFSGDGVAVIYPVANGADLYLVSIQPPKFVVAPYKVSLLDGAGRTVAGGQLAETTKGGLLWWEISGKDLSKVVSVEIVDHFDRMVLKGAVKPSAG